MAAVAGATLATAAGHGYWSLAIFFTIMGLGLAFTDVLTDALMVESGKPRGLTGAFQSVQWAAIYSATMLVGIVGGYMAEHRNLHGAFAAATVFPLLSLVMALYFVHDVRARADRDAVR